LRPRIVLGPPGTGKTTTLLDTVNDYLASGVAPEQIGFISFTKKAVNEARDRAVERFGLDPRRFPYFRTIHSLCFRQLGLATVEVMGWKQYKELGVSLGMKIEGIRRQDRMIYEMEKGELAIFLESLARLTCRTLKDTWIDANVDLPWQELDLVARALDKYKKSNFLIDFTDMLTRYFAEGVVPKLKVLFVDEAQDLCLLQWRIIEKLSTGAETVYVAGDDDQAIFRWSGADVEYFLNLKGADGTRVLHKSYRVPRTVYDLSQPLVRRVTHRYEKEFAPCDRDGSVNWYSGLDDVDMSSGSWLVLVRNGYLARPVVDHCQREGLYYEAFNDGPKRSEALRAVVAYEDLRAGREAAGTDVELIRSLMSKERAQETMRGRKLQTTRQTRGYNWVRYLDPASLPIWHEGLNKLGYLDREYFIACLRRGEKLKGSPRIRITTIHGAKGGESDNVVLFTDISSRTWASMQERPDDEVRVFYVGATRAIENLHVISPQTRSYFEL
jgi:superfamily I DNA/RNA helicase